MKKHRSSHGVYSIFLVSKGISGSTSRYRRTEENSDDGVIEFYGRLCHRSERREGGCWDRKEEGDVLCHWGI